MARFTETVNIGQAPVIQTDTSALTNRLDAFANQQLQQHAQKVAATSFAEGRAAFEEGAEPEFKQERFFGSVGSKAYNEGLRASYVASIDRDNRQEIARIVAENPSDLSVFNDTIESYRKATLASVDPTARQVVSDSMDSLISANRIRVQTSEIEKNHRESDIETASHIEVATNDALAFARNGDDISAGESALAAFATIDARVQAGFITDEQAVGQKRDIEKSMIEEGIAGSLNDIVDDVGFDAAFDELELKSQKVPRGWSPDEWDGFIGSEQARLNRKLARSRFETKEAAKAAKAQASVARGKLFMDPNVPADPAKSSQDRKDVNAAYNEVSEEWQALSGQEIINNNVEFIQSTGIVPDQVISGINAAMRSGTPEQVGFMADLVGRLQEVPNSANVLRDLPDESRAVGRQIADAVRSGIDIEQAIEISRKNVYGLTEQQKELIKINTQAVAKELPGFLANQVDAAFDPSPIPFFGEEPDVPAAMQADYNVAFGKFMTLTDGNPDQAKELAFGSLQKSWAVTDVGGANRFMKSAPEAFYAIDGFDNDWMDEQFNEEMEAVGVEGATISSDFSTGRSATPSYPVMTTNEDGIIDIIRDEETGLPLRWRPDFRETEQFKELQAAPGKAIEDAKAKRGRNLVRRANVVRRKVIHLALTGGAVGPSVVRPSERGAFLESDEGKKKVLRSVKMLLATEKINAIEAVQTLEAFGAGGSEDLEEILGLIRGSK